MATTLKTKNSVTTTVTPTTLAQGELAVNITDKKMWVGNAATTPVQILGAGATNRAGGSNTQVQYNSSGDLAGSANMTFSGTALTLANDASISGLTVGKGGGAVSGNAVLGNTALNSNTTGAYNVAIGWYSTYSNTTGGDNVGIGRNALYYQTTGNYNVGVGTGTIQGISGQTNTGSNNSALGYQALFANTTASNNTAVGYQAGYSNTTGTSLTAIGYQALLSNTTASYNTAIGYFAAVNTTTGASNTAIGYASLVVNTTGSNNTTLGVNALYSNTTASNNTAVGYQAGYNNTTATVNTFIGGQAGYNKTTGDANTFVGYQAGFSATTSAINTFLGYNAGYNVTTGAKNTIIGAYSGNQGGLDIRTASNYIVLSDGDGNPRLVGDNTGAFSTGGYSSGLVPPGGIGAITTSTNQGFTSWNTGTSGTRYYAYFGAGATFSATGSIYYNGTVTVFATTSDQRLKENIVYSGSGLAKLANVKIRAFDWKESGNHTDFGVIAQELNQVAPEAVGEGVDKEDGSIDKPWSVDTAILVPAMIKAIQEQQAMIETLTTRLNALEGK